MSFETVLRDHLVKLLTSGWAHVTPEDGIAAAPARDIGKPATRAADTEDA